MRRNVGLLPSLVLIVSLCWPLAAGSRENQTEATEAV